MARIVLQFLIIFAIATVDVPTASVVYGARYFDKPPAFLAFIIVSFNDT